MDMSFKYGTTVLINGEDVSHLITGFQYMHDPTDYWSESVGHSYKQPSARYEFQFTVPSSYAEAGSHAGLIKISTPGGKRLDALREAVADWLSAKEDRNDPMMYREDWELWQACTEFIEDGGNLA